MPCLWATLSRLARMQRGQQSTTQQWHQWLLTQAQPARHELVLCLERLFNGGCFGASDGTGTEASVRAHACESARACMRLRARAFARVHVCLGCLACALVCSRVRGA
eukprot:1386548-Pleurochrysis_carterae.AAC.1